MAHCCARLRYGLDIPHRYTKWNAQDQASIWYLLFIIFVIALAFKIPLLIQRWRNFLRELLNWCLGRKLLLMMTTTIAEECHSWKLSFATFIIITAVMKLSFLPFRELYNIKYPKAPYNSFVSDWCSKNVRLPNSVLNEW